MNAVLKPIKPEPTLDLSARRSNTAYQAEDYFVLRAPILPVDRWLEASATTTSSPDALARFRGLWREAGVREAVYLASASLHARLESWDWQLRDRKDWKLAGAFYNYISRMATRPTPFGLCAAVSIGRIGDSVRLQLGSEVRQLRCHTRLDTATITMLAEQLCRRPELRHRLRLRSNESGHRVAGRWHYVDWRVESDSRVYSLSSVEHSEALDLVLEQARKGFPTALDLAGLLTRTWSDIAQDDALEFIDELIDSRLLLPLLEPCLTGLECLPALIEELDHMGVDGQVRQALVKSRNALRELDQQGPGRLPVDYDAVMATLAPLELDLPGKNLFQVDLYRDADELTLPGDIADEVAWGAELLIRLGRGRGRQLEDFCQRFTERYEGRRVPLLEVLDEETGIGLEPESAGDDALLQGVLWHPGSSGTDADRVQQRLLMSLADQSGGIPKEIEIDLHDVPPLLAEDRARLAASAHAQVTVMADGPEALQRGQYQVLMHGVLGPSAANMVGRFCFGLPKLAERLRSSLEREESVLPDAVFAEVVHLPQQRLGNLVCRPLLRQFEIPVLGRSGAPDDRQIALEDLEVEVRGQSVRLWSRRLGKQVIPRMGNAHNYNNNALGLYRFLCLTQFHETTAGGFGFGPAFSAMKRLPRVRCGRVILAAARWRIDRKDARDLLKAAPERRSEVMEALRARFELPRLVGMVEGDNVLALDFDNPLAIDALCRRVSRKGQVELTEALFDPAGLCLGQEQDRFAHELVMPLRLRPEKPPHASPGSNRRVAALARRFQPPSAGRSAQVASDQRHRLPGSDWLYYRLHGTPGQLDRALREVLAPMSEQLRLEGSCRQWFFIRYGDPSWHLRWRFQGDPASLAARVIPKMAEIAAELKRRGWVNRLEIASYDREIERYGGPEAMILCERWFAQESRRVAALLARLHGGPKDSRWQTAAWCLLNDLSDLGCSAEAVSDLFEWVALAFRHEFGMEKERLGSLGAKYRDSSASVARACAGLPPEGVPQAAALQSIVDAERDERRAIGEGLRELAQDGRLWGSVESLLPSLVHMSCNRWFSDRPRPNEMVLYELLRRGLLAQAQRQRNGA